MKYIRGVRGRTQTEVAAEHGVSNQAVSQALDAARFSSVVEGEDAAPLYLEWIAGGKESGHQEEEV
ncbi:MAG: hypothetical protein WEG36_13065 [Gemmatimonadota bacterium]